MARAVPKRTSLAASESPRPSFAVFLVIDGGKPPVLANLPEE